jgi:transposase
MVVGSDRTWRNAAARELADSGLEIVAEVSTGREAYNTRKHEKTDTVEHVASIAVRNPELVEVARHYGMTVRTCVPADPESKGGNEATVRIAKADLVPTSANLLGEYRTFGELETACRAFCDEVNARVHRETGRPSTMARDQLSYGTYESLHAATVPQAA